MATEVESKATEWDSAKRSKRLDHLRKSLWPKHVIAGDYLEGVVAGLDKMYWFTKIFKETEGRPWVLRRAQALAATLENMPVFIVDQSQLVGYGGGRPLQIPLSCEANDAHLWDTLMDRKGYVPENDREWYEDAMEYWERNCFREQIDRYLTEEEKVMNLVYSQGLTSAHAQYDFVYEYGFDGIKGLIDKYMGETLEKIHSGPSTPAVMDMLPKIDQWNAMKISLDGFQTWVKRHSRLARIVADNFESDPKRKAELIKTSEVCAKVAGGRPEHLQEAIQLHHFIFCSTRMIERTHIGHGFRLDQLWWPQYEKDVINDKTLTREEALELLAEHQIRVHENQFVTIKFLRQAVTGAVFSLPVPTLGGVTEDGRDACNDLTEAVLEAVRLVRCSMPSYMFRYHPTAKVSALKQVFETIRQGLGYPSIQNDGVLLDTLMNHFNATLEEARGYANVVCMSPGITKGRAGQGVRYSPDLICLQIVGLALHDGFDKQLGMQVGPKTGDARKFTRWEELWEAWRAQLQHAFDRQCRVRNIIRWGESQWFQEPLFSCCMERCVRQGQDAVYPNEEVSNAWFTMAVWNDTGDCLYGAKKLVFEDKKYTMEQLMNALDADWEGYEDMRMDFVGAPKWGNDIDEVDEVWVDCFKTAADILKRNIELSGNYFMGLPENTSAYLLASSMIPALPNGRRLGDPCYDGGNSPGAGLDKKGPTAVLRSCSKIDYRNMKNCLLNQRISHSQMAGDKGFQLWANYMKTWYDLGIPHVQFNCVDSETLRVAQREPEKFGELVVRVAGYSAHFVDLNRFCQDSIIARTLQEV